MIKFYFDFITSGHGKRYIDEPEGFNTMDFIAQKEDDRVALDSTLSAGKNRIKINNMVNHCFDVIMYNMERYGYEAIVKFGMEFDDDNRIIGEVDFATRETDKVTYFEFSVREENYKLKLKRNEEINTNLLSDKDIKGNPIDPCQTVNVLLKAKPIIQVSKWNAPEPVSVFGATSFSATGITTNLGTNPSFGQIQYDIENTLNFASRNTVLTDGIPNIETFTYIKAKENIHNLSIELSNIDLKVSSSEVESVINPNIISATGYSRMVIRWGVTLETSQLQTLYVVNFSGDSPDVSFPENLSFFIPILNRDEKVWIYLENKAVVEYSDNEPGSSFSIINDFTSMDVRMEGTSKAYNTVAPMIRLHDAMKYIVKSASELDISAPRWDEGGEFKDQYLTSTPLLRNLLDKPFNITFKDITDDYLPEVYGDFQIQEDGTVFIGRYPDFYRNVELHRFNQDQFRGYMNTSNPRYTINQIFYKYSNYASQKEIDEENTYDIVHGESQNKLTGIDCVQNKKDINVGWIRDAFLIELSRRKGYDLNDTSATQDDDKVYILDVVPLKDEDRTFTETSMLQHTADGGTLTLANDGSFSWVFLGVISGTPFTINNGDNEGQYIVSFVEDRNIKLFKLTPPSPSSITEFSTSYTYVISELVTSLTNRTSEGFSDISNIDYGDRFANLRFTVARNIRNYYMQYLATANMYAEDAPTNNTLYRNNGLASTRLVEETDPVVENAGLVPENPILTPEVDTVNLFMSLKQFLELLKNIRLQNGYITYTDTENLITKGYIKKCSYVIEGYGWDDLEDLNGTLTAEVEIKYEPFIVSIFGDGDGLIVVNDTIALPNFSFSIDDFNKLHIFDGTGKLMHPPVAYNRVKVNNSGQAANPVELLQWLNAL